MRAFSLSSSYMLLAFLLSSGAQCIWAFLTFLASFVVFFGSRSRLLSTIPVHPCIIAAAACCRVQGPVQSSTNLQEQEF